MQDPILNPTGNALLGTAGTGDVLAGMLGAALATWHSDEASTLQQRVAEVVFEHGLRANQWPHSQPMVASDLI